jgi:hypothetical protein
MATIEQTFQFMGMDLIADPFLDRGEMLVHTVDLGGQLTFPEGAAEMAAPPVSICIGPETIDRLIRGEAVEINGVMLYAADGLLNMGVNDELRELLDAAALAFLQEHRHVPVTAELAHRLVDAVMAAGEG